MIRNCNINLEAATVQKNQTEKFLESPQKARRNEGNPKEGSWGGKLSGSVQNKVMHSKYIKTTVSVRNHTVYIVQVTAAILCLISTFQSAGVFEPEINNPFDVGVSEEMKVLEKVKTCYRHLD